MTLGPFGGVNMGYVLELYERYRHNPDSVDPATRDAFESWTPTDSDAPHSTGAQPPANVHVIVGAANWLLVGVAKFDLAESIRRGWRHLAARLDPLGSAPIGDPSLSPHAHGITDEDLKTLPAALVGGPVAESSSSAFDAMESHTSP